MKTGAQLYTVRDYCRSAEDFNITMDKIKDIGYEYAQLSGWNNAHAVGGFGADIVKEAVERTGVKIPLTHYNPSSVRDNVREVIDFHKTIGADYVGIGAMPGEYGRTPDGVKKFCEDFNPAAETLKSAGLNFMYHNHAFEFERFDGKNILEMIAEGIPSCGFVFDTYWAAAAGADPAAWLKTFGGRVGTIHFKDMKIIGNQQCMCEILEGNLNWPAIFDACEEAGVKFAFVEQDDCYGESPFDCLEKSYVNLKKAGF
jgi:sugar phosphate isomerase/epimerase